MIYISHRGNLTGKSLKDENNPDYIMKAIESGFDVEIDVWFKNNIFYLGHDKPSFEVDTKFLKNQIIVDIPSGLGNFLGYLGDFLPKECLIGIDNFSQISRKEVMLYQKKYLDIKCFQTHT